MRDEIAPSKVEAVLVLRTASSFCEILPYLSRLGSYSMVMGLSGMA